MTPGEREKKVEEIKREANLRRMELRGGALGRTEKRKLVDDWQARCLAELVVVLAVDPAAGMGEGLVEIGSPPVTCVYSRDHGVINLETGDVVEIEWDCVDQAWMKARDAELRRVVLDRWRKRIEAKEDMKSLAELGRKIGLPGWEVFDGD